MIDSFKGEHVFLSNFSPSVIEVEDKLYPTVEHAYQAFKMTTEEDHEKVRLTNTAGQAKKLGRNLPIRDDWDQVKIEIMEKLLRLKFAKRDLKQKLLDTGDQELVEGNYWGDTFWGVCKGKGTNHLGKLLMKLRREYREDS